MTQIVYNAVQIHTRKMFERIRDQPVSRHARVKVTYRGASVYGLSSALRKSVRMDEAGEFNVSNLNVAILADAFSPMPKDNDKIAINDKEYTVADSQYDSVGATVKITLVDVDAQ